MEQLSSKRAHLGLSRFAHYASAYGIEPKEVNDAAIEGFISAVRDGSLHRKPNDLHRKVTLIWNEVAKLSGLQLVTLASFRAPIKRFDWTQLSRSFQQDVERYREWCSGTDVFAADARSRPLAARTLKLRGNQIHATITALVDSGVKSHTIEALADLVSPENFKRVQRQRLQAVGGSENAFNRNLAEVLVQIGREWVKLRPGELAELTELAGKVPMPKPGLTPKNKAALRQFDDPAALRRLIDLPKRLWAEVKQEKNPNFRTLAKAQAALGVAILSYMPVRPGNLNDLAFGINLFIREEPGAISSLELSAGEVKNQETEVAFDIPAQVAKMLIEFRNRIAPKVIGHRPERVFVNADGTPRSQKTVAWLIKTYIARRAGILLTPHQFRHLNAKILLDAEPGSFETVKQLLGHKNIKTTTNFYTGIDSRRAGRHQQRLIERASNAQKPTAQR
jgi:integrase